MTYHGVNLLTALSSQLGMPICQLTSKQIPTESPYAELEDVSYSEEDVTGKPTNGGETALPPLPKEVPPPQPPPEHLRKKSHAELLIDFRDLLADKGVRKDTIKQQVA